jgi:alkylation response protein AidB-like acyl-CoA dehydrogenase
MLACVAADNLRERATGFHTMDDLAVAACTLEDLIIDQGSVLATGIDAERAVRAGWRLAAAAVAADTVSTMGSALARTIGYLMERKQFGQPLAQFQALRHDVARLYVSYELNRNLLQASLPMLHAVGEDDAQCAALSLLGLYSGQEAIRFAECIIQLHGGMGMTREMPAAQLATRLMANAFRFGDPLAYRQALHGLRTRTNS